MREFNWETREIDVQRFYYWIGALKDASRKVVKHESVSSTNQHAFIPFLFDTFGFLAPDVVNMLKRVQRVMHNNVMSLRYLNIVFKRINFVIQKGLADLIYLPVIILRTIYKNKSNLNRKTKLILFYFL
jgi:hypothetical protein